MILLTSPPVPATSPRDPAATSHGSFRANSGCRADLQLFNEARAKNVTVFFITGRRDTPTLHAATERNLRAAGYDGWTALYMRPPVPDDSFKNVQDFKTSKRADISRQFRIIANIGDQQSDLDGGYAERTWRVPIRSLYPLAAEAGAWLVKPLLARGARHRLRDIRTF